MASTVSTPAFKECKSVVTTPSGGQVLLDQGFYNITGLAWSGRGKIKRVDVSADGGRNWRQATLGNASCSCKALTRFNIDWVWDGNPAIIQSRATDDTGLRPTHVQAVACGPRHAFDLSQQRHSVVVGARKR
jgi:sulfane dehydrogenase subunit SoxC